MAAVTGFTSPAICEPITGKAGPKCSSRSRMLRRRDLPPGGLIYRRALFRPWTADAASTSSPSSRGLGHRPFTAVTGVRIPLGTPFILSYASLAVPRNAARPRNFRGRPVPCDGNLDHRRVAMMTHTSRTTFPWNLGWRLLHRWRGLHEHQREHEKSRNRDSDDRRDRNDVLPGENGIDDKGSGKHGDHRFQS